MSQQQWHCEASLLRRYTSGQTDFALSSSIETHLLRCATCRSALSDLTDPVVLARAWDGIREVIQRPPLPLPLRLLRRCGLSQEDAVLLSASQSLRGSWVLATIALLIFTVLASFPGDPAGKAFYLLVAPLVPVLGVVAAFASTDPTLELTNATPYSKTRLALLRTVAVTTTTVPLVVAMGAIIPGMGWLSVAWIGPALGLTLAALVALTWWTPEVTGATVSIAWAVVVALAYAHDNVAAAVQLQAQIGYLGLAALTAAILAAHVRSARTPGGYS